MDYRSNAPADPRLVSALHEAHVGVWLGDVLIAHEIRCANTAYWRTMVNLGFGLIMGMGFVLEQALIALVGTVGMLLAYSWRVCAEELPRITLRRRALAQGLSRAVLRTIANDGLMRWRARMQTRVMWLRWRTGERLSAKECVSLATALEALDELDAEQRSFLDRMEAWWASPAKLRVVVAHAPGIQAVSRRSPSSLATH